MLFTKSELLVKLINSLANKDHDQTKFLGSQTNQLLGQQGSRPDKIASKAYGPNSMLYKDIYKQEKITSPIYHTHHSFQPTTFLAKMKVARQHGMVRTYRVLPSPWNPERRSVQRLDSLPVAGLFSNVPSKPSNHSKFTRKCGRPQCLECHLNPVSKSKNKTKGTQKFRTSNMVVSPRLTTWRIVDRRPGLKFSGFSATGILEYLYSVNEEDDHDDDYDNGGTCALVDDDDNDFMANFWSLHEKEIEEYVGDDNKIDSDYDDDYEFL
ncbi:hypothetical protein CRYUN_Cryun17cG0013700 [Craigia yunnanensis]